MHAVVGDGIVIDGPVLDRPRRRGEVLDVVPGSGEEHYRVRWGRARVAVRPEPDARVVEHRKVEG